MHLSRQQFAIWALASALIPAPGCQTVPASRAGLPGTDLAATMNLAAVPPDWTPRQALAVVREAGEEAWKAYMARGYETQALTPGVRGLYFASTGDPHETSGDGLKFDNRKMGLFTALKSDSADFMLQKYQMNGAMVGVPGTTLNRIAEIKAGANALRYDALADVLLVNGAALPLQSGQAVGLPGGAAVWRDGPVYSVWTPAGDITNIRDQGVYLDITGRISPLRRHQKVKGSLGCFDIDTEVWNDLVLRDGTVTSDVSLFLKNWRTLDSERIYVY